MEERIERPATSFGSVREPRALASGSSSANRFESPTVEEISLCCEISAYAPDGDDLPLF